MRQLIFAILITLFISSPYCLVMAQSCPAPLIFTSSDISDTSIVLRWFALNEPDSAYQIDVQLRGVPPISPTQLPASSDRDTVNGLLPQTDYTAYIRSICESDTSLWKQLDFFTALQNGTTCGLTVDIRDNSCSSGGQRIPIFVKNHKGDSLGIQTQLESIDIIIDHPYPADLTLQLINPAGNKIDLIRNHGTFSDNFGQPTDSTCQQTTSFTRSACESIYDHAPPFRGNFKADEPIESLNDGTVVNGKWILEVCDRAPDDVGVLNYLQLNFIQTNCPVPPELSPIALGDTSQHLSYSMPSADSMRILYSRDTVAPSSVNDSTFRSVSADPADSAVVLTGLQTDQTYYSWSFIYCNGDWLGPSCSSSFSTTTGLISHYSDWESEELCYRNCDTPCTLNDGFWNSNGAGWFSHIGPTPTSSTGPAGDIFFNGKYLYKESSESTCRENPSRLQSICLRKTNADYHGLILFAQLNGTGVGTLTLRISTDEWLSADTLWEISGNQGEKWVRVDIEISDSISGAFQLQLTAEGSRNAFGDIAIGDIALMGVEAVPFIDQLSYPDNDEDGFGNGEIAVFYCGSELPVNLSNNGEDCDDSNPVIHPNALDTVCNGVDENCDGTDNFGGVGALSVSVETLVNPACPLSRNGSIAINISGGNVPYSIMWSNGDTSSTIDSLNSGIYHLTVTDSGQCQSIERSVHMESAKPLQFSFQILERPSCPSPSTGSVALVLDGGTAPYEIAWSNGEAGDTAYTLAPGPFFVEVIDSAGCFYTSDTVQLNPLQPYDANILKTKELSCHSSEDASLRAEAPGSTPPLQYQWNTGDTTAVIDNLPPGLYVVSITDAENCSIVSDSVQVEPPAPIKLTNMSIDPQRCAGIADGAISVVATGGKSPYAFRWQTPEETIITGSSIKNLFPGYYHLTVTDRNGCILNVDSFFIEAQDPIVLDTLSIMSTTCPLSKDGQIEFAINGGHSPYSLIWSDGIRTLRERTGLRSGNYGILITDELECKQSFNNLSVSKGDSTLDVRISVIDSLLCKPGDAASLLAVVDSDAPPYSFNWSAGIERQSNEKADTLGNLPGGAYNVTITDGIGCVGVSERVGIDSFANIQIDSTVVHDISCAGIFDGRIAVYASSNDGPLQYEWSNRTDSFYIDSLAAGKYQVSISDQSNCLPTVLDFHLQSPDTISTHIDTFIIGDSICFQMDSVVGGTQPYIVQWIYGESKLFAPGICFYVSENFSLYSKIIDSLGCMKRELVYDNTTSVKLGRQAKINIYPNPAGKSLYIENDSGNEWRAILINNTGVPVQNVDLTKGKQRIHLGNLPAGIYTLLLETDDGRILSYKIVHL